MLRSRILPELGGPRPGALSTDPYAHRAPSMLSGGSSSHPSNPRTIMHSRHVSLPNLHGTTPSCPSGCRHSPPPQQSRLQYIRQHANIDSTSEGSLPIIRTHPPAPAGAHPRPVPHPYQAGHSGPAPIPNPIYRPHTFAATTQYGAVTPAPIMTTTNMREPCDGPPAQYAISGHPSSACCLYHAIVQLSTVRPGESRDNSHDRKSARSLLAAKYCGFLRAQRAELALLNQASLGRIDARLQESERRVQPDGAEIERLARRVREGSAEKELLTQQSERLQASLAASQDWSAQLEAELRELRKRKGGLVATSTPLRVGSDGNGADSDIVKASKDRSTELLAQKVKTLELQLLSAKGTYESLRRLNTTCRDDEAAARKESQQLRLELEQTRKDAAKKEKAERRRLALEASESGGPAKEEVERERKLKDMVDELDQLRKDNVELSTCAAADLKQRDRLRAEVKQAKAEVKLLEAEVKEAEKAKKSKGIAYEAEVISARAQMVLIRQGEADKKEIEGLKAEVKSLKEAFTGRGGQGASEASGPSGYESQQRGMMAELEQLRKEREEDRISAAADARKIMMLEAEINDLRERIDGPSASAKKRKAADMRDDYEINE